MIRPWRAGAEPLQSTGPTLLHLAAGLGYSRLACALLHWRAENPSSVLDAEVDALRQDNAGLTPLAWACGAGHADTARILYRYGPHKSIILIIRINSKERNELFVSFILQVERDGPVCDGSTEQECH